MKMYEFTKKNINDSKWTPNNNVQKVLSLFFFKSKKNELKTKFTQTTNNNRFPQQMFPKAKKIIIKIILNSVCLSSLFSFS